MSFKDTDFGTNRKLIYDFLLVINTNLPPILHRFRDKAVDMVRNRYTWLPLLCLTPPEGFPWDDLREIFNGCQWIIAENLNRLSRAHERYRQTDNRRTGDII